MYFLKFSVPSMTWRRTAAFADMDSQIITLIGLFLVTWMRYGCTSHPIWRLAHFSPSLSIIDIFVSSLLTTCFHWTSAHEMRSFVHCINFCVCFLFSTGFFREILLFWQTFVIRLHSVLALTKTPVALNTLLFAACDIRIPPRKIYFIPISSTVVLFSASLFCIDGVSW